MHIFTIRMTLYMYFMQAETRKMYKTLLDEDDDFPGFHIGLG